MAYAELGDVELISQIAQARPEAVRALYRRYGRLVYGLALHMVGDRSVAEEITQDVFMRVWEKAGSYDAGKAKVITWLLRIARNQAIDVLRKRNIRGEHESEAWQQLKLGAELAEQDPFQSVELAHQREDVRAAVAALPENQQRALSMAFFQGLTHRQIAEKLGEPLGTVKTRIRDAMQKLRNKHPDRGNSRTYIIEGFAGIRG
jgi:RNA polymerase sigma-70 factor (ECF subfamily)